MIQYTFVDFNKSSTYPVCCLNFHINFIVHISTDRNSHSSRLIFIGFYKEKNQLPHKILTISRSSKAS